MEGAGLTHGGFYAHFTDRDDLLATALEAAFRDGRETIDLLAEASTTGRPVSDFTRVYLSDGHVSTPEIGCAAAALVGDSAHASTMVQAAFSRGIGDYLDDLQSRISRGAGSALDSDPDDAALLLCAIVGAVALSRALPESDLSSSLPSRVEAALQHRLLRLIEPKRTA